MPSALSVADSTTGRSGFSTAGSARTPRSSRALVFAAAVVCATTIATSAAWAVIVETGTNNPSGGPGSGLNIIGSGGGTGSLTVNGGSSLTVNGLQAGSGAGSNGTITIDGAGTVVTNAAGFTSGFDGTGSITVSGGATLDGSSATTNSFVGLTGGSVGSLTVTGAGSTLKLSSTYTAGADLYVGNSAVFTNPPATFSAGSTTQPGIGTATVSAGGTITGTSMVIGGVSVGLPGTTGSTGGAIGSMTITGANSAVNLTEVAPGNGLSVGYNASAVPGAVGNGTLTINAGGALNMSTNAPSVVGPVVNIGGIGSNASNAGGTGQVTINGGSLNFNGSYSGTNTPSVSVGRNQGTGTLNVQNGGTINGLQVLRVGRNGSTGTMTVDGAGSKVTIQAQGSAAPLMEVGYVDASGSAPPGVTTANGTMTIRNGGEVDINLNTIAGGGFDVGRRGGSGSLTVTGAGSLLSLTGDNAGSTSILPGFQVGRSGGGTLNVTAGGRIVVNDGAGYGAMTVGGSGTQVTAGESAGSGTVLVDGAGSSIALQSVHSTIAVGRSGTGSMTVQNGGCRQRGEHDRRAGRKEPGGTFCDPGRRGYADDQWHWFHSDADRQRWFGRRDALVRRASDGWRGRQRYRHRHEWRAGHDRT